MFLDMKADVNAKIDEIELKEKKEKSNVHKPLEREVLPMGGNILGELDGVKLIAFDESYKELFLKTEAAESVMSSMFDKEEFRDLMWDECKADTALYYAVIDKTNDQYVGYVAVKDTRKQIWEIAIVLVPEYRYKGYGKTAMTVLLNELNKRTGERLFRTRVDSDNYASQALMRKMGARTNGISEFLLHGEELEQFQKDNISMIDDKLRIVAEEFCVDVEDLLGHVLEYLIDWPNYSRL